MRNDTNIICRTSAAFAALMLLASCATTEEAPPPPPPPPVEAPAPVPEAPAAESAVRVQPTAPLKYVVQKGDTLWDISQKFLRDAWQWPEVWYVNEQVENPHLIYPGDVLYLTWVGGQPVVAREGDMEMEVVTGGSDKLSPRIRELPLDAAVSAIPRDIIAGFLRGPRIIEDHDVLDDAPYILDFDDPRLMNAAESTAYALDIEDTTIQRYQLVREGRRYVDPDDGDTIGYEAIPVGEAEVVKLGDPSTLSITRSDIETRVGDRLLPLDPHALDAQYFPRAPSRKIDATIIDVFQGDTQIGQYQIVALNRGRQHGLENGHVLSVMQAGREARDPHSVFGSKVQLPAVKAGTVMVFRTAERVSMALVMVALRQIHVGDKAENPNRSD